MLCLIISAVTGFFGAVLRTLALLFNYSTESGHFTKGNVGILPELGWGICIAGAAVCLILCFLRRKTFEHYESRKGMLYTAAATLLVCAMLAVAFESLSAFSLSVVT